MTRCVICLNRATVEMAEVVIPFCQECWDNHPKARQEFVVYLAGKRVVEEAERLTKEENK